MSYSPLLSVCRRSMKFLDATVKFSTAENKESENIENTVTIYLNRMLGVRVREVRVMRSELGVREVGVRGQGGWRGQS